MDKDIKCLNMNNDVFVSICVPIYGVEKYIERCAVSLFEQTYQNIEYIFVNDCTPDNSIEILKNIIERYPERKPNVRIICHDKNRGLAAARNTAVDAVNTEFLMHVDSDDWVETDIVEKCVNKQLEGDYDIVSVDIIREWKKWHEHIILPNFESSKDMSTKLLNGESFHSIYGHLIKTSLYKDNNIKLKAGLNMGEDYYIIPRLSYYAKKVCNLHNYLYHYNFQNESSYVSSFSVDKAEQTCKVIEEQKAFFSTVDKDLCDAIGYYELQNVAENMKESLKCNNSFYYNNTCIRLKEMDKKYIKGLDYSRKLLLQLQCKFLRYIYIKITVPVKACLRYFHFR